jgi:hypothetical protein
MGQELHPRDCGCKPEYRWQGRAQTIRWYHCKRGDVRIRRKWDGEHWIVTVRCLTCGMTETR